MFFITPQLQKSAIKKDISQGGGWIQWNRGNGDGRTYLINHQGGGAGGISFGKIDINAPNDDSYVELMNLDSNGNLNIAGNLTVNGNLDAGNLHSRNTISSDGRFRLGIIDSPGKCVNLGGGIDCNQGFTMAKANGA